MVDFLKNQLGQSYMAIAKRIGMFDHTMKNIRAGRGVATVMDIKALIAAFPELEPFSSQYEEIVSIASEPMPKYSVSKPFTPTIPNHMPTTSPNNDQILKELAEIKALLSQLLSERKTIDRLLTIIEKKHP